MSDRSGGTVAVMCPGHPSVAETGPALAAYALFEGLQALGADVILVAACPTAERPRLRLASDREFAIYIEPDHYDEFYQLASADIWRQIKAIFLRNDIRLANFHGVAPFGLNTLRALAADTDIAVVLTLHDFLPASEEPVGQGAPPTRAAIEQRRRLVHAALSGASALISPSRFLADRMIASGFPADRFMVVENGLRTVPKRDDMKRPRYDGQAWTFGYFGALGRAKGTDTLLEAVRLLGRQPGLDQRIRIKLHGRFAPGEDAEHEGVRALAAAHHVASYGGSYPNAEVFALMAGCDYILMPSRVPENSPLVVQEAFAAGRPVICTGVGALAEKVPHRRAGLHFRAGDATDLVRVMLEAADEPLYRALASDLPAAVDSTTVARSYLSAFSHLAGYGVRVAEAEREMDGGRVGAANRRRRQPARA